jgi:hypothetical protein
LLLSTTTLLYRATEIRPDPLAFSFFSLALAVHFVPQIKPERRGFLSGAFLVMSVWGTQKVIYYGVGFALAFLVDVFYNRRRGQAALLGSPMHFLLGAGMAALPIVGWLVTAGTAGPWFYWCLSWAAEHQSHYPGFPFTQSFVPFLKVEGWLFLPAAVGGLSTLLSWWHHPRRSSHPDLLLMLALPTTFMSYAVQSGPFVYSLLPFIGVLCVFAARGVTDLLRLIAALRQQQAGLGAALYLVLAGGLGYQLHLGAARIHERLAETSNQYQHKTFNLIRQLTAPTDCAYDNSGGYVSRPSAHFFFYTDELIRKQEAKLLNREIPAGIESRGCVLNLVDLRQKRLPQPLRDYLAQNFQPYNGDIRLWGRHYAPDGGRTGRFLATRTDEYFVSDPALVQAGLLIDGKAIENQIFRLEKGWHSLEWTDPQADFYLLWLPADGKPYRPQPQAKPRFSHLL